MYLHRRTFLISLPVAAGWRLHRRLDAAQDQAFVRAWERAQTERPATLSAVSRIAPAGEPGIPLTIRGRVYQTDGRTPAPGIVVFAYQTDREGLYAPRTEPPHTWRLRGWARTGEDGRFEFHTIRPGAYPGGTVAAHVHFSIDGPSLPRRFTPELNFADDPIVAPAATRASEAAGMFGSVRPVQRLANGQLVEFNIRITDSGRF